MKDLTVSIREGWNSIPGPWKRAFLWALAVNCVVFFFELAQFPLGDHDVGYEDGIPLLSGGRAGRWFAPFIHLLSGHVQIPVYTQLLAFTTQIAAAMGAVLLWWPRAGFLPLFAGAVLVSCLPSVTDCYYYHWMAATFTVGQLFMVLSLHLCLTVRKGKWLRWTLATALVTCAMASYQSSMMTWTTCLFGIVLTDMAGNGERSLPLSQSIRRLVPATVCFLIGGMLYYASLRLYPLVGLSLGLYQFQTLALSDIPARLLDLAKYSWLHFIVGQGFISLWLKGLLLIALFGGAVALVSQSLSGQGRGKAFLTVLTILLFPLAAKSQFLVSDTGSWYLYRFMTLGLAYVYAFFLIALLVSPKVRWRNCGLVVFALALPCMAVNDLDQQVRHVRAVEHDMAVLNRVVGRIEALPEFSADKTWHLVQLGRTRPYLADAHRVGPYSELQTATVSQAWHPGFELWLLSKYLKFDVRINEEIRERPDLMKKALDYVKDKKPFPSQEGVAIVGGDTIVLFFDEHAVPIAQKRLAQMKE